MPYIWRTVDLILGYRTWPGRRYIARSIASNPDAVVVTEDVEAGRVIFRLEVADEDKGKVIGRQGQVAQAMRVLLRVAAVNDGTHAALEIV